MTHLLAQVAEIPPATVFGSAGLATQLIWPLFRNRRTILGMQFGAVCAYAASYALLGQATAAATCLTGALQTALVLAVGNRPWMPKVGLAFLPVVLALGALTYAGPPTLFAVAASCLTMIGRLQRDALAMRTIQLSATPFGALHDLFAAAWPALAGTFVTFAVGFAALRRERRARQGSAVVA